MANNMNIRLKQLSIKIKQQNINGLIITNPNNISYLAGYKCRDACVIVSGTKAIYLTDSRYIEEMRQNLKGFEIRQVTNSFAKSVSGVCRELEMEEIGFEDNYISLAQFKKLKDSLLGIAHLEPFSDLIENMRKIKTAGEISIIKEAVKITIKAYNHIKEFLSCGIKEIEVAAELERFIRYHGASCSSFDIIVGSGPNSCFPHHQTSERKLADTEAVLIDMGVEYKSYKSDLTRVFFLGKIDTLTKKVYNTVLSAQKKAIEAVKPGVAIRDIDMIAREYINAKGYGKYFTHGLGHGVGLEVHEQPNISAFVEEKLVENEVFTIEPAIYLPGKFGVRIEDMILVTDNGSEVISGSLDK
jgi:Xaa-Pro aminopeptidase